MKYQQEFESHSRCLDRYIESVPDSFGANDGLRASYWRQTAEYFAKAADIEAKAVNEREAKIWDLRDEILGRITGRVPA